MKIACLGGGPAGLYFAISMKLRDAAHDMTVFERNRPDDTFGWGVVLSDETLDNLANNDPQSAGDPPPFRLLGRHRGALPRPEDRLDRPRLLRHRAQEAVATPAGARAGTRRGAALRDRDRQRRGTRRDSRPRRRGRRAELADAQRIRRAFQARHRPAQVQICLAWHPPEIRRRLHLHFRGDRARLDLGARLSVRRRHRDLHRRVRRRDLAEVRLRHDEPGRELPPARRSLQDISAATG